MHNSTNIWALQLGVFLLFSTLVFGQETKEITKENMPLPETLSSLTEQAKALKAEESSGLGGLGEVEELKIADTRECVRILCSWSQGAKYYAYFNWLPAPLDPLSSLAGNLEDIKKTKYYKYNPWKLSESKYGITITVPDGEVFQTLPDNRNLFVYLDGIGSSVPMRAAQIFGFGFTNGIVARLTLSDLMSATRPITRDANNSIKMGDDEPIFGIDMLNLQIESQFSVTRAQFSQPESFPKETIRTTADFDKQVEKLLMYNDLTAYGMAWGWKAGSEILAEKAAGDGRLYDAAMKLIRGRFSVKKIGMISSYTLSYLAGFSYGQVLRESTTVSGKTPEFASAEVAIKGTEFEGQVKTIMSEIGDWLLSGIELSYSSKDVTNKDREKVSKFLLGWHQGMKNATSDIYESVYKFSYTLGYEKGYKQGYAAGFKAGYTDTYQAAYNSEYKQFAGQLADLAAQIEQAKRKNKTLALIGTGVGYGIGILVKVFSGKWF